MRYAKVTQALIGLLVFAACWGTPADVPPRVTLRFQGAVLSGSDGSAISGATVEFVSAGFSDSPDVVAWTQTDADGRFDLTVRTHCREGARMFFDHVRAKATGFAMVEEEPDCTAATQVIDFELMPAQF